MAIGTKGRNGLTFDWNIFKNILISIFLEAIPFVLLGVVLAALLQIFVSEQTVRRWMPKNKLAGLLFGAGLGILFPICECGMIPVIRRLLQKGMPLYIAVVFLISGPILNPIVFFSTYMAFRAQPEMAYARMGLAFIVALIIGFMIMKTVKSNPLKHSRLATLGGIPPGVAVAGAGVGVSGRVVSGSGVHDQVDLLRADKSFETDKSFGTENSSGTVNRVAAGPVETEPGWTVIGDRLPEGEGAASVQRSADPSDGLSNRLQRWLKKWNEFLKHASLEFFEVGKYLVLGCIITAAVHTTVSRDLLLSIGDSPLSSHLFMMGFAYILSICSTSDAFVASSFTMTFSSGSLLAFLVFGPMMDAKTTLMMLSVFRTKFVLYLMALIFVTVLVGSLIMAALVF